MFPIKNSFFLSLLIIYQSGLFVKHNKYIKINPAGIDTNQVIQEEESINLIGLLIWSAGEGLLKTITFKVI
jgi:hypothetical protein